MQYKSAVRKKYFQCFRSIDVLVSTHKLDIYIWNYSRTTKHAACNYGRCQKSLGESFSKEVRKIHWKHVAHLQQFHIKIIHFESRL